MWRHRSDVSRKTAVAEFGLDPIDEEFQLEMRSDKLVLRTDKPEIAVETTFTTTLHEHATDAGRAERGLL